MVLRVFLILTIFTGSLFPGHNNDIFPEIPCTGYFSRQGNLVEHPFPDAVDSLSGQEILELRDEKGLSIWFCRYVFKDVCMKGQCKMIRLWLFWDGAGNYLDICLPENEPLTKSDHSEFTPGDYEKLHGILHNTESVLKTLKSDELEVAIEADTGYSVDGYSSATRPALSEEVVKNAVYTCHTLWHTVYGQTGETINNILQQRADKDYLKLLFENGDPGYAAWAIRFIQNNQAYHEDFYPHIANLIRSEESMLSQQALEYFSPVMVSDDKVQHMLASVLPEVEMKIKYEILWKFVDTGKTDVGVIIQLLNLFENQELGVGSLNLIYRLIRPEYLSEERLAEILNRLAKSDNNYVRNITVKVMNQ